MKGYKAYDHGLVCRGKQYEVGQTYEEPKAEICECGMHYCDNPADLMFYHGLIDDDGEIMEITEVEDLAPESAQSMEDGNSKKYCTTKLKIGAKISFGEWVKATVDFLLEKTKGKTERVSDERFAQLAASGYGSQLAASGDSSQLAASGDYSQLAASGNYSQLAASGYCSRLAASGSYSQLAASGYGSQLAASGYGSQLAASGYGSQLAASGDYSQLAASGNYSQLAASGENSVVCIAGMDGMAKAAKGCWITLAEWEYNEGKDRYIPVCVKTERVDGERIKADTWYRLIGGEFVEAENR